MSSDHPLVAHRRQEGDRKVSDVQQAIARLRARQEAITVAGVAVEAGVHRSFIYKHPGLKASIEALRSERPGRRPESASAQALRAENARLRTRLSEAQARASTAETQLRRTWGAAVENVPSAELTQRITDLEGRNAALAKQLGETEDALVESTEMVDVLTEQLEAARRVNRELTKQVNGG